MVNGLLPFIGFVEQHPVGSTVAAVVESYSSHGAYVTEGDARGYVPLRLMAEPPPRSARSVMKLGDTVELVVVSFNATRRSIDLAVPGMEPPEVKAVMVAPTRPVKRSRKKAAAEPEPIAAEPIVAAPVPAGPAKRTRKKAAKAPPVSAADETQPAEPLPPPAVPAVSEEPAPAGPAKRTRKKAAKAPPAAGAAEPVAASPAPLKRSRKKAAAPVPEAPPPEGPVTPVKRTRRKAPPS
jgi:hypothetical protein